MEMIFLVSKSQSCLSEIQVSSPALSSSWNFLSRAGTAQREGLGGL